MLWWHYILLVLPMVPNLYSIWHIRTHYFADEQQKSLWFLLAVFVPVIGGIVYLALGRKKASKTPWEENTNPCDAKHGI